MTRLLVSVRNAAEARIALDAGADWIDVKEPARGALGSADAVTLRAVVREVDGARPVSAALGELFDSDGLQVLPPESSRFLPPESLPNGVSFAKLGLAGAAIRPGWRATWASAIARLPQESRCVAAAYADWRAAHAPQPSDVLEAAASLRCAGILVDTFDKRRGGLLTHVALPELRAFIIAARRLDMFVALAGKLDHDAILRLLPLDPDIIAVRSAVCSAGRDSDVEAERVGNLVKSLKSWRSYHKDAQVCQPYLPQSMKSA